MEITEERRGNIVILRIIGKLDSFTSTDLEERILALVTSSQGRLVMDLSQLDYVSSAGLRVLLLAQKRMDGEQGRMILCSLQDAVKHVFDVAGFSSFVTVATSTEEAIQNLAASFQ